MNRHRSALMALLCAAALAGCGGGGKTPPASNRSGSATFRVEWPTRSRVIPVASNSIKIQIHTVAGLLAERLIVRPDTSATFDVLPEGSLTALAAAYPSVDGAGTPQAKASVPLKIEAGRTTSIRMTLESTVKSLRVLPLQQVEVGQQKALEFSALDEWGSVVIVAANNPTWSAAGGQSSLAFTNGMAHGLKPGIVPVTVTMDGLTSPPEDVIVPYIVTEVSSSEVPSPLMHALNNLGQVVGYSLPYHQSYEHGHAVLWDAGATTDLGALDQDHSEAFAVNDRGTIVGEVGGNPGIIPPWPGRPFVYANGRMTIIDTADRRGGAAYAINKLGQVTGHVGTDLPRAFVWLPYAAYGLHAGMNELGTLPGDASSRAVAISDSGVVLGYSTPPLGSQAGQRVFMWQNGAFTDLGTLGFYQVTPVAINGDGLIAGSCYADYVAWANRQGRAFVKRASGMEMIELLPGQMGSYATGMNRAGDVVGVQYMDYQRIGFLNTNGKTLDLNRLVSASPGWRIVGATAINDRGQILCTGELEGVSKTLLLSP